MSGRGGSNRRGFRHRDREQGGSGWQDRQGKKGGGKGGGYHKGHNRLKWVPPVVSKDPLPALECLYCGKPIKDVSSAIGNKYDNKPIHFDCIMSRLVKDETLEKGDVVAYIGGGRFGIVCFNKSPNAPAFRIKKILEWEDKENRAEWRKTISDRYSIT